MATQNATNTSNPITVAQGGTGLATLTAHAVQVGSGTSNVTQLSVGSNGQVLIGSTSADPAFATISSSGGTVTYTTGAHTLNIDVTNPVIVPTTDNTGAGIGALANITAGTGNNNTGFGFNAANPITTGTYNTAVGYNAMSSATNSVTTNTAIGAQTLVHVQNNGNTAVGEGALYAQLNPSGSNTAFGTNAGGSITSGGHNTCIGTSALVLVTTGTNNIGLGDNAGSSYTSSESSNICIGNTGTVSESNVLRIGTSGSGTGQQSSCYIAGISGATSAGAVAVVINGSGQLGTIVSSARYKENIKDMLDTSSDVYKLRPVNFNYKLDQLKSNQFGLIAEEVKEIMPHLVAYDLEGNIQSVKYHDLVPMLLNELIKLNKEVQSLKDKND